MEESQDLEKAMIIEDVEELKEEVADDWGEIEAATTKELQELRNFIGQLVEEINVRFDNHKNLLESHHNTLSILKADTKVLIKEAHALQQQAKDVAVRHALEDWENSRMWVIKKLDRLQSRIRNTIKSVLTWLAEKV